MSHPKISVIIRSFNEEIHIERLLQGLFAQTVDDVEVILVDSGSTDKTLEIARSYPVRVIHIDSSEFSFGRSLNRGCSAARGEYLVFISAHCYPVRSTWLEKLIEPLKSPEVAVCYGRQSGNENTRFSEHRIFSQWFPEQSVAKQTTPFYNNANAAIRRRLWKITPFNEELTGLEDLEWGSRAIKKGYHLAYSAEAEIIHEHNESHRRIYNRYLREAIAFHQVFPEQTFNVVDFVKLLTWNSLKDYQHAWKERRFLRQLIAIPAFRLMQFFGTYRGYSRAAGVSDNLRKRFYYPAGEQIEVTEPKPKVVDGELIDYGAIEKGKTLGISFRTQTELTTSPAGIGNLMGIKSLPGFYTSSN